MYRFWNNVWPTFSVPYHSVVGANQGTLALDVDGAVTVTALRVGAVTTARIVRAGGPAFARVLVDQHVPSAADLLGPSVLYIVVKDDAPPAPAPASTNHVSALSLQPLHHARRQYRVHHTYHHSGSPVSPPTPTATASSACSVQERCTTSGKYVRPRALRWRAAAACFSAQSAWFLSAPCGCCLRECRRCPT